MPETPMPIEQLPPPRSRIWLALRVLGRAAELLHRAPKALPSHARGRTGEDLAYWCLRQRGYTIVARNLRLPGQEGEIDLIGFEGQPPCLTFVEVKTRSIEGQFAAEDAVDAAKRHHLIRIARAYRRRRAYTGPFRYDVVAIYGPDDANPRITLHRSAFSDSDWGRYRPDGSGRIG